MDSLIRSHWTMINNPDIIQFRGCKLHVLIPSSRPAHLMIGYRVKSFEDWKSWFSGKEEYEIPRESPDFIRLEKVFNRALNYYYTHQRNLTS